MSTKAYQCSQCEKLNDLDDRCSCEVGILPVPGHREKGDAKLCRKNFEVLEPKKQWHERFSWE